MRLKRVAGDKNFSDFLKHNTLIQKSYWNYEYVEFLSLRGI